MPSITANISTPDQVKECRRIALESGVSLRVWAGDVIEKHLSENRKQLKQGPRIKNRK